MFLVDLSDPCVYYFEISSVTTKKSKLKTSQNGNYGNEGDVEVMDYLINTLLPVIHPLGSKIALMEFCLPITIQLDP